MSGKPAARVGDMITCPVPQSTPAALPHAPPPGLPIVSPGAPTVLIGGQPAARVTDFSICITPAPTPNQIAQGSRPVPIAGQAAARMTDQGTHPGSFISPPCCPTVLIGLAGCVGNTFVGTAVCKAVKTGRPGGSAAQDFGNCGVESARQLIEAANPAGRTPGSFSEVGLLQETLDNGLSPSSFNPDGTLRPASSIGGTTGPAQVAILGDSDVPATTIGAGSAAMPNIQNSLMNGEGVIANLDAAPLWQPQGISASGPPPWYHAVAVTGIEYDDNGNPTRVFYNDTGAGQCGHSVPYSTFQQAMNGSPIQSVATTKPIW